MRDFHRALKSVLPSTRARWGGRKYGLLFIVLILSTTVTLKSYYVSNRFTKGNGERWIKVCFYNMWLRKESAARKEIKCQRNVGWHGLTSTKTLILSVRVTFRVQRISPCEEISSLNCPKNLQSRSFLEWNFIRKAEWLSQIEWYFIWNFIATLNDSIFIIERKYCYFSFISSEVPLRIEEHSRKSENDITRLKKKSETNYTFRE